MATQNTLNKTNTLNTQNTQNTQDRRTQPNLIEIFPTIKIRVLKSSTGRIWVVRRYIINGDEYLTPKMLNAKPDKLVHSAITKQLEKYFVRGGDDYFSDDFVPGYDNVPAELLEQLYVHLRYAERLCLSNPKK